MSKKISIIIPVQNEEGNIALIYLAIKRQFEILGSEFSYEIIFVDDGSTDRTFENIQKISQSDSAVSYLEFSRNFGKEIATTAGLNHASGDAVIIIDADMQHPPVLIPEFIKKWQAGADMVIGVRQKNHQASLPKKLGSYLFYKIMAAISDQNMTIRGTDYRLLDRKVINEFNRFTERNRITRGLLDWLGFKKDYVYFEADKRLLGTASYKKIKLLKLALSAFVAHSLFPLKIAGYLGILIIAFSGPLGLFIFVNTYIINDPFSFNFSGPAILAVINLFLIGIVLSCLGLIAMYIGNIQNEVMNRPMYVVRSKKENQ